jgi:hypothetical protein
MDIISQLGGRGPQEVRRQGMALATLAVAGNEDLADRILERSEEMTPEEQQFFQGAQTPTKEKDGTSILGKRSRSPEEIEMNRQNAIQRREYRKKVDAQFRHLKHQNHMQQMQIRSLEMQMQMMIAFLQAGGLRQVGHTPQATIASHPEPADAVTLGQVLYDMSMEYIFDIEDAVCILGREVSSAYRRQFGRCPAKRLPNASNRFTRNLYEGSDPEVMGLVRDTIRLTCAEKGWEE